MLWCVVYEVLWQTEFPASQETSATSFDWGCQHSQNKGKRDQKQSYKNYGTVETLIPCKLSLLTYIHRGHAMPHNGLSLIAYAHACVWSLKIYVGGELWIWGQRASLASLPTPLLYPLGPAHIYRTVALLSKPLYRARVYICIFPLAKEGHESLEGWGRLLTLQSWVVSKESNQSLCTPKSELFPLGGLLSSSRMLPSNNSLWYSALQRGK